jgi:long-chain fatty acid transport protein
MLAFSFLDRLCAESCVYHGSDRPDKWRKSRHMQRLSPFLVVMVLAGVLAGGGAAWAQGFGVYEQSACMIGRGGAGVAAPCADASAVYFNPAGLSFDSKQIGVGAALIGPYGDFTDNTTKQVSALNKKWYPAPNIYFSTPIGKKVAAGVGVFAPYGLTTDWPVASQGRYLGYKSLVQGLYIQPTVAFKLSDKVSIGAGVDITYLNVELRQRVDLAPQTLVVHPILGTLTFADLNKICPAALCGTVPVGTDFADLQLKGHNYSAGFHVGLLAKANDKVSFGFRWMSGQKVDVNNGKIDTTQIPVPGVKVPVSTPAGTVFVPVDTALAPQFVAPAKLADQNATSQIPLPDQVVFGVAIQASAKLRLLADYQFTRWSMFDTLPIDGQYLQKAIVESYENVSGIRLGAEFAVGKESVLRVGFDGHGPASPDQSVTPNLPEGSRQEYTVGFGSQFSKNVRFDFAYMFLHQPERAGRTGDGGLAVPTTAQNNGVYNFDAHIFNVMLGLRF